MEDRRPDASITPQEQVEAATRAMLRRQAAVYRPDPSSRFPRYATVLLLLMVVPVSASLLASGSTTSRYDVIPALLGFGGVDPTHPALLWIARAGFAVILGIGGGLWWWVQRELRRAEHRRRA